MNTDACDSYLRELYASRDAYWRGVTYKGRVCVQSPTDLWLFGEIVRETRPCLIVETGSWGGGAALYLADLCHVNGYGDVVSVDTEKRERERHLRVRWIEADSTSSRLAENVIPFYDGPIMVTLDSDHRKEHVLAELDLWAPHVTPGCYLVVQDTLLSTLDPSFGEGPGEALAEWLPQHPEFEVDAWRDRFGVSMHRGGWLRRLP